MSERKEVVSHAGYGLEEMLGRFDALLTRLEGITGLLGTAVSGNLPPSGASVLLQYPRDPEQEAKDQEAIDKVIAEWRQGQTEAPPLAD